MKRRRVINILAVLVILIGCSVLLYPTISNYLIQRNSTYAIDSYNETLEEMEEQEKEEILAKTRAYNETLVGNQTGGDPFAGTEEGEDGYWDILDVEGNGLIGYLQIPKIHVELPIYHGTKETVLQKGIGHWKGTSLPIGGSSTHSVLTGHRGLPTLDLFSDLDQLVQGDVFYVKVLGETMAYQVDSIQTVLPQETESLRVFEGQDYVTLVTCTPYAVNTHRLLVRGVRIPYEEAAQVAPDEVQSKVWIPMEVKAMLAVLAILILIYVVYRVRRKKKR